MEYAPGCFCSVHKALDYLNTSLKGCLSPGTVAPIDVMHTCKTNVQKAQLDSMVFITALKARGPPTSEKQQRPSVGRKR